MVIKEAHKHIYPESCVNATNGNNITIRSVLPLVFCYLTLLVEYL